MRLACALALVAAPALAECPMPSDMDGYGIRFSATSGDTETFQRMADGSIESTVEAPEGTITKAILTKGMYLTRIFDLEDGKAVNDVRYTYPTALDNLPEPFPNGAFKLTIEGRDDQGDFTSTEIYQFGEVEVLFLGTCALVMIPVDMTYGESDDRDVFHYLPDFGVSYLAASYDADGRMTDYSYDSVMGLR